MASEKTSVDFATELAIGKPNSLGNTLKIVKIVESDPKKFPQLLKLLLPPTVRGWWREWLSATSNNGH